MIQINHTNLKTQLDHIIDATPIYDIHTHIYAESFGDMLLCGIDELLTYHYLIAEYFRYSKLPYDEFFSLQKSEQAQLVWDEIFVKRTPFSESARGILTILKALEIDFSSKDLGSIREQMNKLIASGSYTSKIFEISKVSRVVMTNDPFDMVEEKHWKDQQLEDKRFLSSLRLDMLINNYVSVIPTLKAWGYNVDEHISGETVLQLEKFVGDYIKLFNPLYLAVSLPADFTLDSKKYELSTSIIEDVVLPVARKYNKSLALMVGAIRQVNPAMRLAGDWMGQSDLNVIETLAKKNPENKFLVTSISRENQHQLIVLARKFRNLHIFGCWWQLNIPETIVEMTNMRLELLGLSVTLQHSDARVLEQLIYKWAHFKELLKPILFEKYGKVLDSGWALTSDDIQRDINLMLGAEFDNFVNS